MSKCRRSRHPTISEHQKTITGYLGLRHFDGAGDANGTAGGFNGFAHSVHRLKKAARSLPTGAT
jgi:hypothetical protein